MISEPQVQVQHVLPSRVNQLRMQFNFREYSPINSESEDNNDEK